MLRRSAVWLAALALVVAGVWIQQAISEESPAPPPGPNPDPMRQRMEQFRQQMADRMKEALGANDEEWKALQPRIEKVVTLVGQARGGGMGFMFGRRGPRPGEAATDRPQTEIEKTAEALEKLLQNKDAKPEEIKPALAALREARAKARAGLETAQKELREVLTLRQEAQLVMMGVLD